MAAGYLFLAYNCLLVCRLSFPDRMGTTSTKDFTLSSIHRKNQPLWKSPGIA